MGVFSCDIAHRRSVVVLCMLHKIRRNTMHPLNGAKPGPYVPVLVTRGPLVAHRYTYARLAVEPRSTTGLVFISLSVSLKPSIARSLPVENLLPQNVGSIINYLQ